MADLSESAVWGAGVYQIETTDPVLGGAPNPSTGAGMTNIPHQQLANRTAWLKGQVEALQTDLLALNAELDALAAAERPVILPVLVATTADIVLSGLQTIDGVSVTANRRVLVKNQVTASQNGIYVAGTGAWSRATDMAAGATALPGSIVAVTAGTSQGDTLWTISSPNQGSAPVVGTSSLVFSDVTARMAPLASPALTGIPTAPTAAVDTDTTQIATTAFVLNQAANVTPLADGTAAVGTATRFARQDHRHPTDTTRAPLASPAFTGTPTAPLAAQFDNSGALATTAFVKRALGSYADAQTFTGDITLTASQAGDIWVYGDNVPATVTLPSIATVEVGSVFEFINTGPADLTIQRAGTNQIDLGSTTGTSIVIPPNQSLRLFRSGGSSLWHPVGLTAQARTPDAPGSAPIYSCRAWVNFNGTGTVSIRGSGNVSSVTDNGSGDYTINFATPMPDANYVIAGFAALLATIQSTAYVVTRADGASAIAAASARIGVRGGGGTLVDVDWINVAIFR